MPVKIAIALVLGLVASAARAETIRICGYQSCKTWVPWCSSDTLSCEDPEGDCRDKCPKEPPHVETEAERDARLLDEARKAALKKADEDKARADAEARLDARRPQLRAPFNRVPRPPAVSTRTAALKNACLDGDAAACASLRAPEQKAGPPDRCAQLSQKRDACDQVRVVKMAQCRPAKHACHDHCNDLWRQCVTNARSKLAAELCMPPAGCEPDCEKAFNLCAPPCTAVPRDCLEHSATRPAE